MGIWHTNGSPNLGQKTIPYNNNQLKKRICKIVDFAVPADHRIKMKEYEKKDKYFDFVGELKNLWNMTIVPIVIGAVGTVTKGLLRDWRTRRLADKWRPTKLQHYWGRPESWEESWNIEETCCHSGSSERPFVKLMWKTLNEEIKNIN